ncbi:uncharacterized protein LOC110698064 [Chenopodium quinoa]|uniref:uncharacterized protein LOC110698064 n=1 Tax=Chenopodium quinoa TaxID=63459 RepID=UPI000B79A29B|nr:uncharacterized protein LOC110698064 [Chenopodium quinoa]
MAEVSFLHFPEDDHDLFVEHDVFFEEFSTLDSFPYSFSPRRLGGSHESDDFFAPSSSNRSVGQSGVVEGIMEDRKNQVNFVIDLLHEQVEQSHIVGCDDFVSDVVNDLNFGVIEENYDVGVDALDLELRLGLGLGLGLEDGDGDDCNCGGFVVSECGDEFYIARRETGTSTVNWNDCENENGNDNDDEDEIPSGLARIGGLMMVGVDSDSEEEGNGVWRIHVHSEEEDYEVDDVNDDESIPLCWDSLNLEEVDQGGVAVDFEWEEVDDRVDEREILSVAADAEGEGSGSISVWAYSGPEEDGVGERERGRGLRNSEWEVLLNANHIGRNSEMIENDNDAYFDDHDNIFHAAEYEMMFGQFPESENTYLSRPPASKSVVEKLPSVITTKEDVLNEKALCAVCKDQIEVGEEGKQLPCSHRFHGDCILPWLGIRNTCPLCRYELPTDDPDYEQRRVRRAARVQ